MPLLLLEEEEAGLPHQESTQTQCPPSCEPLEPLEPLPDLEPPDLPDLEPPDLPDLELELELPVPVPGQPHGLLPHPSCQPSWLMLDPEDFEPPDLPDFPEEELELECQPGCRPCGSPHPPYHGPS